MKKLVIAEKPSVAKNIADATSAVRKNGFFEGEDYIITWAFGHLLQLYDAADYDPAMKRWRLERFPYIPESFRYKVKSDGRKKDQPDAGAKRQLSIIDALMKRPDVDGIISATDDDREGQIIADEIFGYLKPEKPVERILLNEWTAEEVKRGLANRIPNRQMQSLRDAGFGRQIADWLIGINLTSVATLKYREHHSYRLLNVGRVLMPTLKIIYDRDKEIETFKATKSYKLVGTFCRQSLEKPQEQGKEKNAERASFEGTWYEDKKEKFDKPDKPEALKNRIAGHKAQITQKKVTQKKEYPPYLFNLTGLQGFITGKYRGWTSDKVLKVAQNLYEKKLITYPRTASSVLDESLKEKAARVLAIHKKTCPYADEIAFHTSKRIFDSRKVESHSAIIPTYVLPKNLSEDEQKVYEAVRNRFLAQFMPLARSEDTVLTLRVLAGEEPDIFLDGVKGIFIAKGKIQIEAGWKKIEDVDSRENRLPPVQEKEIVDIKRLRVVEVEKKPPKPHTEKSLLKVMETCGKKYEQKDEEEMMMAILSGFSIGTPATRAETIKKLKTAGYIRAKGKSLVCTDLGRMMVETFPARELFDLEYTGRLEKTLSDIERKKFTKTDFLSMIEAFVRTSVAELKANTDFGGKPGEEGTLQTEPLGICPECGSPVVETPRAFGCSNWRNGCTFAVWKNDRLITSLGKKVSPEMVHILLEHGKVGFRNCRSKKGNLFSAYFYYEKDKETGRYRWRLEFIPDPAKKGAGRRNAASPAENPGATETVTASREEQSTETETVPASPEKETGAVPATIAVSNDNKQERSGYKAEDIDEKTGK